MHGELFFNTSYLLLTSVYAHNNAQEKIALWKSLVDISATNSSPWVVLGDFNSILLSKEKSGDSTIYLSKMANFRYCVFTC